MTTITATLETNGVSQQLRQNAAGILFLASAKPDWVTITGYKTSWIIPIVETMYAIAKNNEHHLGTWDVLRDRIL